MAARVELQYSRSAIKRAGKQIRRHHLQEGDLGVTEFERVIDIFEHWRACHSYPLQKATMGLRSRVASSGSVDARVSQRLKRRPTIVDKLIREPSMQLTTMQDIGGCRAVLVDVDEIRRVQRRWTQTSHRVERVYDYMANPKPSGYRGVHLVVQYDGFTIEVQLRTQLQHAWGIAIERVGPRIGADLKSGEGPEEVLQLFRMFGALLARREQLPADEFDGEQFSTALAAVDPLVLQLVGLEISDGTVRLVMPD